MKNKYFILAVTFLSLLIGHNGWGQDYDLSNPSSFNVDD
jgi:hypothetical protein